MGISLNLDLGGFEGFGETFHSNAFWNRPSDFGAQKRGTIQGILGA